MYSKEFRDNPGRLKCDYLKKFRESLANKYHIDGFKYESCPSKGHCQGFCAACEQETLELQEKIRIACDMGVFTLPKVPLLLKPFDSPRGVYTPFDLSSYAHSKKGEFSIFGIERLSINKNGSGIVDLVGLSGCPLNCKYCINKEELKSPSYHLGVIELFELLNKDSLYYDFSNGGVCFGGGEPLLQINSIIKFIKYAKSKGVTWRFGLETSLNLDIGLGDVFRNTLSYFDYIIVDVKDLNNDIYVKYTDKSYAYLLANLIQLLTVPNIEKRIRVPLIPNYNNTKNISNTVKILLDMGYSFKDLEYLEYQKVTDAPTDLPIMMGQMRVEPIIKSEEKGSNKFVPPLAGKVVRPTKPTKSATPPESVIPLEPITPPEPVKPVEEPIPLMMGKMIRTPNKDIKVDILKNKKSDT